MARSENELEISPIISEFESNTVVNMASDSNPITLTFNNLRVFIDDRKILDNVSGSVKPGEVLAVMGPSGSGKTTLLNFLAGRRVGDSKSGEVLLNGRHVNKKLKRKICYVLQEDLFFDNLTLRETLTYSALLRLPDKMPKAEKLKKVEEIIEILDLKKCADTKMGNSLKRGLSGGEKKRANIGCELITNPSLLFLDEPTSGLDSSNAYNLVKTLEAFAEDEAKTIVMTIHQPSSQIFHLFDKLLLLVNGKVAYYGNSSDVLNFFERIGFPCEEHYNPADYILEVLSRGAEVEEKIVSACQEWIKGTLPIPVCVDRRSITTSSERDNDSAVLPLDYCLQNRASFREDRDSDSLNSSPGALKEVTSSSNVQQPENDSTTDGEKLNGYTNKLAEIQNSSPAVVYRPKQDITVHIDTSGTNRHSIRRNSMEEIKRMMDNTSEDGDDDERHNGFHLDHGDKWPTSFWTQFFVLSHRTFKQSLPIILSKLNLVQNLLLAIIIGLIWFQVPHEEESISDRRGLLFFFITYWSFNPLFHALLTFPSEEVIIRKERSAGSYRLSAYYFGKCLSEVPLVVCYPIVFLFVFYWLCGLNPSVAFLGQALTLIINAILAQSIGLAIGATVMSFNKGIVVAAVSMLACMLLGGFYTRGVPFWLKWVRYISFLTYSYENCLIMEFTGIKDHSCAERTSYVECKNNATVITGSQILEHFNISRTYGENLAILVVFIVVFRAIGYCSLRFLHKPK
ncbi:ABC transporter G family member 14 isoform X3 [Paramuricea clavata]|uniref:ABC transporter G family member 14 isoform X3 n=1 Tax=Paramuricea clavata TaxID=317549 RepID=A0A7D9H6F4_PARCT|nr:ABC transporter G family member 14 isoform X3 [Paramuricea clavata]